MNQQLYIPRREAWGAVRRLHDYAQDGLDNELADMVRTLIEKLDRYETALGFMPGDGRIFITEGTA
jgi:hypothetical protein